MRASIRAAAVAIGAKDLLRRIRDRSAILLGLVLPFVMAGIFSLTLGGADQNTFTATYAFADADGGQLPSAFRDVLGQLDFVTIRDAADAAEAERLAEDGDVDAAFVFPPGFSASVQAGAGGSIEVIASPESSIGPLVAMSLARSFAGNLDAVGLSVAVASPPDATPAQLAASSAAARSVPAAAVVQEASAESRTYSASTFFAIGMAVFFLFFTVEFGVRGLLEEREEGTLARLLVAPIPPSAILLGKAFASFAVGLASTAFLVVATSVLLDSTWGNPVGVALLVVAGVSTAVAVTALVATLAKSAAQVGSYASIVAVVGGLLGGTFFPISQAPGLLASLRFLSPQGWLMEGFQQLASGGTVAQAAPAIVGTLAIGAICGAIAWRRASSLVAR